MQHEIVVYSIETHDFPCVSILNYILSSIFFLFDTLE